MDTAKVAEPLSGAKLYQERARAALPLLVRQAEAGNRIYYSELAAELGMPNPRNLNFVLGSIGQTMQNLSKAWDESVPPIQCLVVNREHDMPGEGVGWFLTKTENFAELPRKEQQRIFEFELRRVFAYPYWRKVLAELGLAPATPPLQIGVVDGTFGGSGEGPEHRALKEFVARNPGVVGLPTNAAPGALEQPLLSGDSVDVAFTHRGLWLACEIKPQASPESDIQRGLFQCVKYRAVMEAESLARGEQREVRAVLVLGSQLPAKFAALRNMLGVEVFESVAP